MYFGKFGVGVAISPRGLVILSRCVGGSDFITGLGVCGITRFGIEAFGQNI